MSKEDTEEEGYYYYTDNQEIVEFDTEEAGGYTIDTAREAKRLVLKDEDNYYYLNNKRNCIF